jgi:hypothetical protein
MQKQVKRGREKVNVGGVEVEKEKERLTKGRSICESGRKLKEF